MGLEIGTYISDLNPNNPVHISDTVGESDDHHRLIKSTILNTFPNITGEMSLSHLQLNDAAVKSEANTFTGVNAFNAVANFNVGPSINAVGQADGFELLRFNQDRAWSFETFSTGSGNALHLRSLSDGKAFRVTSPDGSIALNITARDANAGSVTVNDGAGVFGEVAAVHKVQTFTGINTFNETTFFKKNAICDNNFGFGGYESDGVSARFIGRIDSANRCIIGDNALSQLRQYANSLQTFYINNSAVLQLLPAISGGGLIWDRTSVAKKIGFRNPGVRRDITVNASLSQDDEGQIVRALFSVADREITIPQLEEDTQITIINRSNLGITDCVLKPGTGVTVLVLGGNTQYNNSGEIRFERGTVCHLQWESATLVNVWGGGLSRA